MILNKDQIALLNLGHIITKNGITLYKLPVIMQDAEGNFKMIFNEDSKNIDSITELEQARKIINS